MVKAKGKTGDRSIQPVYIHPLTDFGFKKLFLNGELLISFLNDVAGTDIKEVTYLPTEGLGELENNMDTWLFLLKNTFELKSCPKEITGKIFKLFLEIAKVKHLTSNEMETYKKSLENNYYVRDIANLARMEGEQTGIAKGEQIGINKGSRKVAAKLLVKGTPVKEVMYLTELSRDQVLEVLKQFPES